MKHDSKEWQDICKHFRIIHAHDPYKIQGIAVSTKECLMVV